jgi:hypothetical protein
MPTIRDISFDEETTERTDRFRETFGDPTPLDTEAMRWRWADNLDRARERLEAEHGKRRKVVQ